MFKRILVLLDGSVSSEAVLPRVKDLIEGSAGEEMIFLRVIEPLDAGVISALSPQTVSELNIVTRKEAESYLKKMSEPFAIKGLRVKTLMKEGKVAETILDTAIRVKADLIAMASHGRGGLARFALGSVADRVMRYAQIPVLVVRVQTG